MARAQRNYIVNDSFAAKNLLKVKVSFKFKNSVTGKVQTMRGTPGSLLYRWYHSVDLP